MLFKQKMKATNGEGSPKKRKALATLDAGDLQNVKAQVEIVNQAALTLKMTKFAYNDTLRRVAEKYGLPERYSIDLETGEALSDG